MAKAKKREVSPQPTWAISKIFVPDNVRDDGWQEGLGELQASIQADGLQQPIKIKVYPPNQSGPAAETAELVFGQRRLECCKRLGWTVIPVIFDSSKSSAKDRFIHMLVENNERLELTPLEQAKSYKRAISEFKLSAGALAKRIGVTSGHISQRLKLLDMSDDVKDAVEKGDITATHARELSRITDENEQKKLLKQAKKLPITEFKEKVAALDPKKKRQTKRGRKAKVPTTGHRRSDAEATEALGKLDERKKTAVEKEDDLNAQFYKGMIRGIGWSFGKVKNLI